MLQVEECGEYAYVTILHSTIYDGYCNKRFPVIVALS